MEQALEQTKRLSLTGGRAVVARGLTRAYAQTMTLMLFVSLLGNVWAVYALRVSAAEHKRDMRENFIVWQAGADGTTTASNAAQFRQGPHEEQLNAAAWRIVSLIESAGSVDVKENYARARLEMTQTLATDFDETLGANADEIAQLGVYNVFDQPEMRQARDSDFPKVERLEKLSRYDRIVTGTRTTYSIETREALLKPKRVTYYVRLSPLPAPEVAHPEGVLVELLIPLKTKEATHE